MLRHCYRSFRGGRKGYAAMLMAALTVSIAVPAFAADLRGNLIHSGAGSGMYFVQAVNLRSTSPLAGMDVRSTPGPYEIPGVPSGSYVLFAWKDLNGNMWPGVLEPFGWYGQDLPAWLDVGSQDIDGLDIELNQRVFVAEVRGRVNYTGVQQGRIWIIPHQHPQFALSNISGTPWTVAEPGDHYNVWVFEPGSYYVTAFMDLNWNLQHDPGEPIGTRPQPVVVGSSGATVTGADVLLVDAAVAVEGTTWSQVKALYTQ